MKTTLSNYKYIQNEIELLTDKINILIKEETCPRMMYNNNNNKVIEFAQNRPDNS